jgi:hypothetical protein
LIFSVIQVSATGSVVRIHVSQKDDSLNITVWVSHPWLGDGITDVDPYFRLNPQAQAVAEHNNLVRNQYESKENSEQIDNLILMMDQVASGVVRMNASLEQKKPNSSLSRESLGLLLSCQLAEIHGGQISIQGSQESGYRYVLVLPLQTATTEAMSNN